jgi:predicted DNA binding protein
VSVIAELSIQSDEFILGQVLSRYPGTHIEMERVIPASGRAMPYVWVTGDDLTEFETDVGGSDYVRELTALDATEEARLYRVGWAEDIESLIFGIAETNATILEARGRTDEDWYFRIRFDDHAGMGAFHEYCDEHGIRFELTRVYTLTEEHRDGYMFDLTDAQRRALVTAVRNGYFEVPRRTTLGEVGSQLGITEQSVSESVRRGADKVLKSVLLEDSDRGSENERK